MISGKGEQWKRLSPRRKRLLEDIISDHQKYNKSYFWTPGDTARQRRSNEWERKISFVFSGSNYEIRQRYNESCNNCYYDCKIKVGGERKDIRAIKKILEG